MSGMVNERAIPNPPEPCGEKSSDQTKEDDIGLDHKLIHLGEERDRCI